MGFEAMSGEKEEDIASLWELIGAQRVKENRVKLTLFLKKMKNSKLFLIWRGWSKFMAKRRKEGMDADKDSLFNEHSLRMAGKKKEEVEAMLRTFLKRMHFARLNGKFLDMCWRGWRKFVTEKKLAAMGEGERFKRLKTFLGAKLKGIKYAVFHAICCEARDQKKAQMMNSDKLKKVACYLEMICRGIVQRVFGAMKRYKFMAKQMRDEEERLRALLMEKHSQSMHRLKLFLMGKEKRMMYGGFRWWQNCTVNSKFGIMEREVERARKARIAAEEECAKLRAALGNEEGKAELRTKLEAVLKQKAETESETTDLSNQIEEAKNKLAALKDSLAQEKAGRRDDKLETARLVKELDTTTHDKEDLDKEMALIVDQIGFLSEYSSKKAK